MNEQELFARDMLERDTEEAWLAHVASQERHLLEEALKRMICHASTPEDHALICSACGMSSMVRVDDGLDR